MRTGSEGAYPLFPLAAARKLTDCGNRCYLRLQGLKVAPGDQMALGAEQLHRFNLNVGVNVTNILNHFNPSGYNGNLTSTLFGLPTGANTSFGGGGPGGGGGASNANNRRLDFSMSLNF